mmetsp:Transcript_8018/g.11971  ORF Transcript_8018/g.11971 Transcript_8018/m.11971 type:complete len:985 (+) Transcript_8018:35-2989(+)
MEEDNFKEESINACPICLDNVSRDDAVNLCSDKSHGVSCRPCMVAYIDNHVQSSFLGTCPMISCPHPAHTRMINNLSETRIPDSTFIMLHKKDDNAVKKGNLLVFDEWKFISRKEVHQKYLSLARSLLSFLCVGCHSLKSLDVGCRRKAGLTYFHKYFRDLSLEASIPSLPAKSESYDDSDSIESFSSLPSKVKVASLVSDVTLYCGGAITVEEFYTIINIKYFPQLKSMSNDSSWKLFIRVLYLLSHPERRANLHLRYLRDRPKIRTACCSEDHCFRCQIHGFHEGQSCIESAELLDHSIVPCPSCGLHLSKGDGCDSISCPCGKKFSWSSEKENRDHCFEFLRNFPANTSTTCAIILCTNHTELCHQSIQHSTDKRTSLKLLDSTSTRLPVDGVTITHAKAWKLYNQVDVRREMCNVFNAVSQPFPSQYCTTLLNNQHLNSGREEGMREAAQIWKDEHSNEVERCFAQNKLALESLIVTFYPDPYERCVAVHKFFKYPDSSSAVADNFYFHSSIEDQQRLKESARLWMWKNKNKEYQSHMKLYELNCAKQFLQLYGSYTPMYTRVALMEWDRLTSNSELIYSDEDKTLQYFTYSTFNTNPAAFCCLPSDDCTFKARLSSDPRALSAVRITLNGLSFGLARKGMVKSGSKGVGRISNTWGLFCDKGSSSKIAASGEEVSQFRMLREFDIFTVTVSLQDCYCDISVNDDELRHRFVIPPGGVKEDYCFAMTLPNLCHVTIINDASTNMYNQKRDVKSHGNIIPPAQFVVLNKEQLWMRSALKYKLKNIVTSILSDANKIISGDEMQLLGDAYSWQKSCGDDHEVAIRSSHVVISHLANLLNLPLKLIEKNKIFNKNGIRTEEKDRIWKLSWNRILDALGYYCFQREKILLEQQRNAANHFHTMHGAESCFVAAMNLVGYYAKTVLSEEQLASLAYMKEFESDMQKWYYYNACMEDPILPNIIKSCRCVPRHSSYCPITVVDTTS